MDELFEATTMCTWTITSSEQSVLFNENTLQASPSLLSSASILKKCVLSLFHGEATQWFDFKAYDTGHGMTFWGKLRDALFKEYAERSFSDATVNTTTSNVRRIISKVCPELHIKTTQYLVRASDRQINTGTAEETRVGRLEEARVDSLCAHGLEGRDVSDSRRWAKGAPPHAGAYDAQDVVASVVKARKSSPPPRCG